MHGPTQLYFHAHELDLGSYKTIIMMICRKYPNTTCFSKHSKLNQLDKQVKIHNL